MHYTCTHAPTHIQTTMNSNVYDTGLYHASYMRVHACTHACTHTHTHACTHAHARTHARTHAHVRAHAHITQEFVVYPSSRPTRKLVFLLWAAPELRPLFATARREQYLSEEKSLMSLAKFSPLSMMKPLLSTADL